MRSRIGHPRSCSCVTIGCCKGRIGSDSCCRLSVHPSGGCGVQSAHRRFIRRIIRSLATPRIHLLLHLSLLIDVRDTRQLKRSDGSLMLLLLLLLLLLLVDGCGRGADRRTPVIPRRLDPNCSS